MASGAHNQSRQTPSKITPHAPLSLVDAAFTIGVPFHLDAVSEIISEEGIATAIAAGAGAVFDKLEGG